MAVEEIIKELKNNKFIDEKRIEHRLDSITAFPSPPHLWQGILLVITDSVVNTPLNKYINLFFLPKLKIFLFRILRP